MSAYFSANVGRRGEKKQSCVHLYTDVVLIYRDAGVDKPLKYLPYDKESQGYWKGHPEVRAFGKDVAVAILQVGPS